METISICKVRLHLLAIFPDLALAPDMGRTTYVEILPKPQIGWSFMLLSILISP